MGPELMIIEGFARLAEFREMLVEYAAELDFDLCFQGFDKELAGLPGAYAAPEGAILMALWRGEAAGCLAIRPVGDGVCEMKRLFVRPAFRGKAIGRALVEACLREAKAMGYRAIRLDTIESMVAAIALYRDLGFVDCEPYTANPLQGALFLEKNL